MISVLILTKNEASDIEGCIRSVLWSDDIVVFDSKSTDSTQEIAMRLGARVIARAFDNYAAQRNAALHETSFKHEWVLSLDADERVTDLLARDIGRFVRNEGSRCSACRIRRKDYFMGRWLKHAQISPYYVRLVRPSSVRYERAVNEVLVVDGAIGDVSESLVHHPFSKGVSFWIERHNSYSTLEAARALSEAADLTDFRWRHLFALDFNIRRRAQKRIFYLVPMRVPLKFCYMMFWRRAFLDGVPGFHYTILQCIYEYFITLKEAEAQAARVTKHPL